jgi:hypothetical protein
MKWILLHIALLCTGLIFSQNDMRLSDAEYRLEQKLNALRAAKGETEIKAKNRALKEELEKTFEIDGAFDYPFDRLRTLGTVKSPDGLVRLFNWNIERPDFTHEYYCYVLYNDVKKKKVTVTELVDNSMMLPARPTETLTADNWYGALYYNIIPVKKKGKTYYTLLGWDGNTASSNIKLIDVMYFVGNKPKLGHSMFKMEDGVHKRLFFEHKEQAIMTMRYDHERKMIVYDHLSPESPALKGFYSYYVPDMSYDGLEFMDDYWVLRSDIISTNKDDNRKKMTIYTLNDQKGQVEKREVKVLWNNPENPNAPVDNGKHTAVLPEVKQEVKAPKKVKTVNQQPGYTYPSGNKGKKSGPGSILQKGQ